MDISLIGIVSLLVGFRLCLSGGFILLCSIFHFPCSKIGLKLWTLNLIFFHINQLASHLCYSCSISEAFCVTGTVLESRAQSLPLGTCILGGKIRHQATDFKLQYSNCDRWCFERYAGGSWDMIGEMELNLDSQGEFPAVIFRLPPSDWWIKVNRAERGLVTACSGQGNRPCKNPKSGRSKASLRNWKVSVVRVPSGCALRKDLGVGGASFDRVLESSDSTEFYCK